MEFQTDIFEGVEPPSRSKYILIGTKIPTSQDVYIVFKWQEHIESYEMARKLLRKNIWHYIRTLWKLGPNIAEPVSHI